MSPKNHKRLAMLWRVEAAGSICLLAFQYLEFFCMLQYQTKEASASKSTHTKMQICWCANYGLTPH